MTKIDASTVIGANELIEGLKRPFDEIDKNIGDLESEILKLQKEVANVENPFSIQSLGKVKETKEKINLYDTSKAAADAEREKMLKAGYDKAYEQANKIISDHQSRLFQEFKPKSEEIKQKIKEIKIFWEKLADRAIATMLVNKQMDRYGEETKQIDKIPKKEND